MVLWSSHVEGNIVQTNLFIVRTRAQELYTVNIIIIIINFVRFHIQRSKMFPRLQSHNNETTLILFNAKTNIIITSLFKISHLILLNFISDS
ncbi:hypothetical protein RJT34_11265 [Clitoria ternatea]|uniref:Uncharacterized protein n=1 Tax=Clitoria ternatea TaxID=43366 RepID=A0AAN9JLS8_CLITE